MDGGRHAAVLSVRRQEFSADKANQFLRGNDRMKTYAPIVVSLVMVSGAWAQERPWQQISDPTAAQLAARFAAPPSEYASQFDWGFSDKLTREQMAAILDRAKGFGVM